LDLDGNATASTVEVICSAQHFRQNEALDNLQGDVDELNSRVKGANQRARKLVAK
jgi:hypothetical protein